MINANAIALSPCLASRMAALASSSFRLDLLAPAEVAIDLRLLCPPSAAQAGEPTATGLLETLLPEASIPLLHEDLPQGQVAIDAPAFLGRDSARQPAALELCLALYLCVGVLASPVGPGLVLAGGGLSPSACRLLEDRLAWLWANRALIGPGEAELWLPRLASAFETDYGRGF
jgi:hypothetical protein